MQSFIEHFTYLGVALVILAGGFGLPIPEDVPLMLGGYLCGKGYASLSIMLPFTLFAVVGADCIVYWLGRKYGWRITQVRFFRRFLTPERLSRAEALFHKHGGKTLFAARFMPGLRTPCFFSAGVFKVPFWKLLVYDGGAALLSAPAFVLLGWYFADRIHDVIEAVESGKWWVMLVVVGVIALIVALKLAVSRFLRKAAPAA